VPGARKAKPSPTAPQADIASLETELSESLGTKVAIAHGRGGKGKLVIHYTDLDTLEGVLERLRRRQQG
jgi:ParB family chromosome partitioning protein